MKQERLHTAVENLLYFTFVSLSRKSELKDNGSGLLGQAYSQYEARTTPHRCGKSATLLLLSLSQKSDWKDNDNLPM